MKKAVKGAVEKLQNKKNSTLQEFTEILDASNVETHSGAVQKFDMLLGVSARNKLNRQGVVVCSRTRFSRPFESFWFNVDSCSHYCFEQPKPRVSEDDFDVDEV